MNAAHSRARGVLARADALLSDAAGCEDPSERFLGAYVAALRGAGALLALIDPVPKRGASRSAWVRMARAAPEFDLWAGYFEDWSSRRAAIEGGTADRLDDAAADEFFDRVGAFLYDVEDRLAERSSSTITGSAEGMTA